MRKRTLFRKTFTSVLVALVVFAGCFMGAGIDAESLTKAENDRFVELYTQGVPLDEISKILQEEFGYTVDPNPSIGGSVSSTPQATPKPTHTHTWRTDSVVDSTCANEGAINYVCDGCGETKSEATAKTEHDYELTAHSDGNCSEVQTETYTCTVCGDSYTIEGEMGEHIYILMDESVPANCETEGNSVYECNICKNRYSETVPALGHKYTEAKETAKPATCTESGVSAYICIRCNGTMEEEEIPAQGHTTVYEVYREPELLKKGIGLDVCTVCTAIVNEHEIPAKIPVPVRIAVVIGAIGIVAGICVMVGRRRNKL